MIDGGMSAMLDTLLASDEPAIRYKVRIDLLDEDPTASALVALRGEIQSSARARQLLSERQADGTLPHHPYAKWDGAHWILVALADLGYPPGDAALVPLREQVLAWLLSHGRAAQARRNTIDGRVRMCASMEGNAIYALLALGLADARVDALVERLLAWQWPDGGWNCDKHPKAHVSSFHETLIPLRALARYARHTGDFAVRRAAERAAEVFLARRLFRRLTDGRVIANAFLRLYYPWYWHYNVHFGLKVLDEAGHLGDPRCREARDVLWGKQLADGGFPAEKKYYQASAGPVRARSLVDWGGTSISRMNPFLTVEALTVLRHAHLAGDARQFARSP
jgi:hypothetical protein